MPQRKGLGKKERYEILYEEVNSKLDLLLERYDQFQQELQRGFQGLRAEMNGRFSLVEQALKEVSMRLKAHEETHAR